MKSKTAFILSGILIIISSTLIFAFSPDPLALNLFRLLFTSLLDCAICAVVFLILKIKRKVPRLRFSLYIAGNAILILFGFFLVYAIPVLLAQKGMLRSLPILARMKLLSPLLSSLLTIDIALLAVLNGAVSAWAGGIPARTLVLGMLGIFSVASFGLFFINTRRLEFFSFVRLAYLMASGSLWIVFFLPVAGIATERKKGKFLGMIVLTGFLAAETAFQVLSWNAVKKDLSSPPFHSILLSMMGCNLFAGFLSWNLPRRKPLMKTLPVQLPVLVLLAVAATAIVYGEKLAPSLFFAFAYAAAVALALVGACLILDKKAGKSGRKLLLLSILLAFAAAEAVYLLKGLGWMGAPLWSLRSIGPFALLILLEISFVVYAGSRLKAPKKSAAGGKKSSPAVRIKPPFEAYKGQAKFVFVSYSHREMEEVFSICHKLFNEGFRIWYDEGIEPGKEWPETIGKAIESCAQFLFFATPSAVGSRNVRNEINYALQKRKEIIVVMLKKTKLSYGLELQIGTVQAIHRFEMNEKEFFKRMHAILKK